MKSDPPIRKHTKVVIKADMIDPIIRPPMKTFRLFLLLLLYIFLMISQMMVKISFVYLIKSTYGLTLLHNIMIKL